MKEPLIDIAASPVADVLDVLLQDKTTKKNIIWATDSYAEYGEAFADTAPDGRRRPFAPPRHNPSAHPQDAGRTGAAHAHKSRSIYLRVAVQPNEQ